mgnify:CR=1 FL=1
MLLRMIGGAREGDSGSAKEIGDEWVSDILKKVIRAGIQSMLGTVIFSMGAGTFLLS